MHEKLGLNIETDKPRDKCAVVGIMSIKNSDVAPLTRFALHAQQNRGEDGAGIAVLDKYSGTFRDYKGLGLVLAQALPEGKLEEEGLSGSVAIGHNRYATAGKRRDDATSREEKIKCLQPYVVGHDRRSLAGAHNGNIPDKHLATLKQELPSGIPFQSDTDSEVISWRILFAEGKTWREKIINGFDGVVGAYSYVVATDEGDLFGVTDPLGIRPLTYAETENERILVSESRGLEYVPGIKKKIEIENGQLVHIRSDGSVTIEQMFPKVQMARCMVESLYLAHPYSEEDGEEIRTIRERMGMALARERPFSTDYTIVGIPDSGREIAEGYARELGLRTEELIKKDRYRPGRTFIKNSTSERYRDLDLKFTISSAVRGKKLVTIDDTKIRGNTTKKLNARLREMGAEEIHELLASPPFQDICDKGVDIPTHDELIALRNDGAGNYTSRSYQEIAEEVGADSVYYLSQEGLIGVKGQRWSSCTNCMTGVDPVEQLLNSRPDAYRQILLPANRWLTSA